MENEPTQSAIVIMEAGSEWPAWMARFEASTPETRVIAQRDEESPGAFAERVRSRLDEVSAGGEAVETAVLACSERADDAAEKARRAMARATLSFFAARGKGSLLFTASERQHGSSRSALSCLVTDLGHECDQSGVYVGVRFGQASRPPQQSHADTGRVAAL